ncbi:TonB-dependent receptor [Rhodohalobacter sp. 8-1]|uniref:TonB-dependent receptor n=1 Tax=Rhodohalobacter sp. 8-1 TaxID=3131972 RepID=UPI0030EE86C5
MYKPLLLSLFLCLTGLAHAQSNASIYGTLTSDGEPLTGVNIGIADLQKGVTSASDGTFKITGIPPGTYLLQASSVGYKTFREEISFSAGEKIELNIQLEESLLELDQLVVTGTMRETYVKDSPVKVNVVSSKFLNKNPGNNLMESVSYINGLYNQVDCGVCSTNSIRINGMEGAYTAVLIDGMPIMGSLASVYGLNGINTNIIESIEIIKGPNSTLYGSEAMGGVINIRTKDPKETSSLILEGYTTSHLENNIDFSYTPDTEGFSTLFSGNGFYFDKFLDQNGDNFADVTKRDKLSLFNKWSFERAQGRKMDLALKYNYENRVGGTPDFSESLRGSNTVYGEAIRTHRFELLGTYELPVEEQVRFDYSYSYHDQDSYYGDYRYQANQQVYFGNLIWDKQLQFDKQLMMGAALRFDRLDQTFNEQRLANGSVDERFIPGIFAQYEQIFSPVFRGLVGARVDHFEDHGLIFSPRVNLKLSPSDHTTLRVNAGTGFRVVNLFTEEHEALTGSREVVITEDLNPERSYNMTVNLNQIVDIGVSVLNMDIDAFYTHFTNQIIPNYEFANEIRYANLDGNSVSRGVSFSIAHNFPGPLVYSAGVTFQDVYQQNGSVKESLLFAPDYTGVFSLSYGWDSIQTYIDFTGRIVGKMKLPEYPDAADVSKVYTEQNVKLSKRFSEGFEIYGAIKNLFNYTQDNPLIAPDRPFSDEFATDHVYGPLQGRRFMLGVRYQIN